LHQLDIKSFVTTAGLFAIDRADAALRRGKEGKMSVVAEGERNSLSNVEEIKKILKCDVFSWVKTSLYK
jgi:hypothetical protein